ncbi:hypothetical protein [Ruminiclostridium papyrosolvens]|uniref:Peptidase U32 n=1 Tax=Ruminiclostridium papyrosolvens C7 TaxID=1330534 RepID=U4R016_9FIRM|nr:hypothetical protein [Ruminiclostridium papyrosolvens]EPR10579.1 hypothetical protein L323_13755 [Ruminiclostridium papyrosolvens C7]
MELEIRITHNSLIDEAIAKKPYAISLGHEGCLGRLPDLDDLVEAGKRTKIKLVLPKILNHSMTYVENYIRAAAAKLGTLEVTVNDFGTMLRLYDIKGIKLIAGRLLIKAFEEHPLGHLVSERYPEEWRQNILQSCIFSEDKISLLKQYNVVGIEMNIFENTAKALQQWNLNEKIAVHGFFNQAILAVFRYCPHARLNEKLPPDCRCTCERYIPLEYVNNQRDSNLTNSNSCSNLTGILDGNVLMREVKSDHFVKIDRQVALYPEISRGERIK